MGNGCNWEDKFRLMPTNLQNHKILLKCYQKVECTELRGNEFLLIEGHQIRLEWILGRYIQIWVGHCSLHPLLTLKSKGFKEYVI